MIETKFEIKRQRLGHKKEEEKSARILNRVVTYTEKGTEYESDQRHAEIIIKQMGLDPNSKGVYTPGLRMKYNGKDEDLKEFNCQPQMQRIIEV